MDLCVWNRCNNHCIMCTNPEDFQNKEDSRDYSFQKIVQRIEGRIPYLKKTKESINITGGEPTTHPYFLDLCFWFREKLPKNKIALASNGRMFSYESFVKKLLKIDNLTIEVAILGPDERAHDSITRVKGSFEQTIKGLKNILKFKNATQELELRIILIKQNYKLVKEILSFISRNLASVDRVVIIFPEPEGECGKKYDIVGIKYLQIKDEIFSVMQEWGNKKDLRLYHFPLCTLDPSLWKYTWVTQRREEISFPKQCTKCSYQNYCCGVHKDYLKIIGDKEFQPPKTNLQFKFSNNKHHPIINIV